jgi:hypothetical protein
MNTAALAQKLHALNASKVASVLFVLAGIVCQVSPALAQSLTDAGFPVGAHWVLVVAGVVLQLKGLWSASISDASRIKAAAAVPGAVDKVEAEVDRSALSKT